MSRRFTRYLPLEALDDDLFDIHLRDQLPPEGQLKTFEGDSERVDGSADFVIEISEDIDAATLPSNRTFTRARIPSRCQRVFCRN
jgi:hypothetical protein